MTEKLYARLRENVNLKLRRGAWYKVLLVEDIHSLLEVNGRPISVATALLEIVKRPPPRWTVVVPRESSAKKTPSQLGTEYGVCPSCGERAPLSKRAHRLRCPSCKWEFEVAWDEGYLR
ncbi:MAG TPA: hypothetical protein VMH88_15370 [Gemmatimonadales bacterium]|nr:hypothetical protein [Gemmatimonadales bacterium]